VTRRGWMFGRVPVVPGPGVAAPMPNCVACGYGNYNGVIRTWRTVEGWRLVLCVDWQACCSRFGEGS
jgi:hypothetical protein